MSHNSNTILLERAAELIDETAGMSWISKSLQAAMDRNDLDELRGLVNKIESELAVEHFHAVDGLPEREMTDIG